MRAALARRYGSPAVVSIEEIVDPMPRAKDILIEVHATTVTAGDSRMRSLNLPTGFGLVSRLALGLLAPRQPILGSELAGKIAAVGSDVSGWRVGDEVVAFADTSMGCHAEYKVLPEHAAIARKPAHLTFETAAALGFGGTTALHYLRRARVRPGETILINGASGSVGSAAVQLACHFGAHVTAVCSTANLALARELGADRTIDYTATDCLAADHAYDVIIDTTGTRRLARALHCLGSGGRLVLVAGSLPDMLWMPWVALTGDQAILAGPAPGHPPDFRYLAELAQAGEFAPVIDRCYPFEQAAEAHRYVDTGHKRGNVVLSLR